MNIMHILLALSGSKEETQLAIGAMTMAKRLKAHVAVAHAVLDDISAYDWAGAAIAPPYLDEAVKAVEAARRAQKAQSRHVFDAAVAETEIPLVNHPTCGQASTWFQDSGEEEVLISDCGRITDLIVLSRPHGTGAIAQQTIIEEALFTLRRPVLMLPYRVIDLGDSAAVAWNGSLEAANALRACTGLLKPSGKVTLIQVGDLPNGAVTSEEAADYLGWHCLDVQIRRVEDKPKATAKIILGEARAANAQFLAIGAYSHTRLREVLLGGVTATMLQDADLPVLLAH